MLKHKSYTATRLFIHLFAIQQIPVNSDILKGRQQL